MIETIEGERTIYSFKAMFEKVTGMGGDFLVTNSAVVDKEDSAGIGDHKYVSNSDLKILLVEDNEVNRMFFTELLNLKGFHCDVAVDGEEGVKAWLARKYDIILMDCQMPILDGYEATLKIRRLEKIGEHIPIIAITAYAMSGDVEKCKEAGMDDYLSKPVDINKLINIIRSYSFRNEA